jgi:uncharacterized SAM-binding protein YcdF (DUF218 family)
MVLKRVSKLVTGALAGIGAITLVLLALAAVGLLFAGDWLRAADAPAHADAIVVLAGAPERAMYAADLLRQGYAPVVYVSRPARERGHRTLEQFGIVLPDEEHVNRTILQKRGVADQYIRVYVKPSINTLDEARAARSSLPPGTRAIMVVTSPYHVRRVKMVFGDVFADTGTSVTVVAGPYEPFPDRWWTEQDSARQTILELMKVIFYKLGGSYSRESASE